MKISALIFLMLASVQIINGDTLFYDNFQSGAVSSQNWLDWTPDNCTVRYKNGTMIIGNMNETYSGMAYHTFGKPLSVFTITARFLSVDPGSGIYFCVNESNGHLAGYFLQMAGSGRVTIFKERTFIADFWSAALTDTADEVTISKKGSVFNLFGNNAYLGSFTDDTFGEGHLALAASAQITAIVDYILVTTDFLDSINIPTPVVYKVKHSARKTNSLNSSFVDLRGRNLDKLNVKHRDMVPFLKKR